MLSKIRSVFLQCISDKPLKWSQLETHPLLSLCYGCVYIQSYCSGKDRLRWHNVVELLAAIPSTFHLLNMCLYDFQITYVSAELLTLFFFLSCKCLCPINPVLTGGTFLLFFSFLGLTDCDFLLPLAATSLHWELLQNCLCVCVWNPCDLVLLAFTVYEKLLFGTVGHIQI